MRGRQRGALDMQSIAQGKVFAPAPPFSLMICRPSSLAPPSSLPSLANTARLTRFPSHAPTPGSDGHIRGRNKKTPLGAAFLRLERSPREQPQLNQTALIDVFVDVQLVCSA